MDTKNIFNENYLLKLKELYYVKYGNTRFDVIISSDDDAFNFCIKYQHELFNDAPLVFCGVNNFDARRTAGRNISGVVEAFDIRSNLELIHAIHPDIKKIYVINDKTTTGEANKVIFKRIAENFKIFFEFEYLENLSMKAVCEKISKTDGDAVIFLMTFNRDENGQIFSYDESMRLIAAAARVPIYGLWDFYLGGGITGGMMINAASQGKAAADIAVQILGGSKNAAEIPIITTSPNRYMFDYDVLKKHGIPLNKLPENSVIINRPFTFYSIDKNVFRIIILLSTILIILSSFLITSILKKRAAEKELLSVNKKLENIINELENIVDERTGELLETNKNLKNQITEREKIEKELLASEMKYRTLTENAYDIIFETDPQGKIIYVSPNSKENFGHDSYEMNGRLYESFVYKDDAQIVKAMFNKIEKTGYASEIIFRNSEFENTSLWFESSGKLFNTPEGRNHIVIVTRNITDRKKIDEEMIKNAKLESLGLLAGGIAHDFNNVLMGITGNIALARRRCNDQKIAEILLRAEKVSYKARGLTEQLITFSKGGLPIKKIIDINEIIREAVWFSLSGSSMKSEFTLDSSLRQVAADEGQLIQVITNIAINARQAAPENGILTVRTENFENTFLNETIHNEKGFVKITISDNGCGIEKSLLKKIFDPYFTTRPAGRGIGLAAAHSIIKNHDGLIKVESKPGAGTTFDIYLPAAS